MLGEFLFRISKFSGAKMLVYPGGIPFLDIILMYLQPSIWLLDHSIGNCFKDQGIGCNWIFLIAVLRAVDCQVFVATVSPARNPGRNKCWTCLEFWIESNYQAWGHSSVCNPWYGIQRLIFSNDGNFLRFFDLLTFLSCCELFDSSIGGQWLLQRGMNLI